MVGQQEVMVPAREGGARDVAHRVAGVEPMVRGICRARLGTVEGDDAAQRTLLGVWRALERGQEFESLASYAAACARYEALSSYRDSRRRPTPSGELAEQLWADDAPGPAERAERVDEVARAKERVETLLAQLSPREAEVMRASVLAGRSTADAAELLGITATGVRSAQVRAMARMRELCGTRSPNPLASNVPESARRSHSGGAVKNARLAAANSATPDEGDTDGDTDGVRAGGGPAMGVDGRSDPLEEARDAVARAGAAAEVAGTDPSVIDAVGPLDLTPAAQEVEAAELAGGDVGFDGVGGSAGFDDDADAWDVA